MTQELIVQEAAAIMRYWRATTAAVGNGRACIFYTLAACLAGRKYGQRLIPVAGSASWPRIPPEEDDGVCATHFSYVWTPPKEGISAYTRIARGEMELPELHAWATDSTGVVVDLSTGELPDACKYTLQQDWTAKRPPPYFWGHRLPEGWYYQADIEATGLVVGLCNTIIAIGRSLHA